MNLIKRILSGIVLAAVTLGALWLGTPWLEVLVMAVLAAAAWEWTHLGHEGGWVETVPVLVAVPLVLATGRWIGVPESGGVLALGIVAALLAASLNARRLTVWPAAGVLYLGIPAAAFVAFPPMVLLWLLIVVWATDIGAYAAGRAIGGPKLAPTISPHKTQVGALGGLVLAMAAGAALPRAGLGAEVVLPALTAALLSVAAQLGDLFESWAKRRAGVKDAGRLIPGHGGVLDRIDGLLFAAPVLAGLIWLTDT